MSWNLGESKKTDSRHEYKNGGSHSMGAMGWFFLDRAPGPGAVVRGWEVELSHVVWVSFLNFRTLISLHKQRENGPYRV